MTDETTSTSAAEPLWSDERIYDRATYHRDTTGLGLANGHWITSREMRDEYQARIAELQGQVDAARAGSFVPLPDGEYTMQGWGDHTYTLFVSCDGAELEAWGDDDENKYKDGSPKRVEEIGVGEYRLCRLQPASD